MTWRRSRGPRGSTGGDAAMAEVLLLVPLQSLYVVCLYREIRASEQ